MTADMGVWAVTSLLLLLSFQQCLGQSLGTPGLQNKITPYIIMGVILGVIVIVVIVILIVSCGRWNWNWRNMNSLQNRKAVRVSRTSNLIRRIHRKPKLKLGMKRSTAFQQTVQSDTGGSSRALFVMGDGGLSSAEPDRDVSVRSSAGPHVARVELDGSYVPSTSVQPPAPDPPAATISSAYSQRPGTSSHQHVACPQCSNPNVNRIECPDVRHHHPHHHAPAPAAIYPQLGDVMQPQHQINIHAAVPAVQQPAHHHGHHHHHPQSAQAQPLGIYPNLGGHTHAHVVTQHPTGHVHSNMNLSPPAYQTMERTQQKY